ncbi:MAG: hypothetical protein WAV90_03270 [Gordonia amarae]
MATATHIRLPDDVDKALSSYAARVGAGKSTVISQAVSEWLRAETHRGIAFVSEVTGERRAALINGPQVWTIAEAWLQHEPEHREARELADTLGLSPKSVATALTYWADNREEIDSIISRHHLAQDEALATWERRQALGTA